MAILRNHDGDPSGNPPPEPQAQGDSKPEPQYVTVDVLKQVLAENNNSVFATARRIAEQTAGKREPATPPPKGDKPAPAPVQDFAAMRQRYDALNDELSEFSFTKEQKARVRSNFDAVAPENIGEWLGGEARLYGVDRRGTPPPATPNQEPAAMKPRPSSDGGAPAQAAGIESSDPAWTFSQDVVDRMVQKHGMVGAGQVLRQRLQRDMRGRKFYVGPDKRR